MQGKRNIWRQTLSTLVEYVYVYNRQSYLATNTQRHVISRRHRLKISRPSPLRHSSSSALGLSLRPFPPPHAAAVSKAGAKGGRKRPSEAEIRKGAEVTFHHWRNAQVRTNFLFNGVNLRGWLWKIGEGNNIFQGRFGKFLLCVLLWDYIVCVLICFSFSVAALLQAILSAFQFAKTLEARGLMFLWISLNYFPFWPELLLFRRLHKGFARIREIYFSCMNIVNGETYEQKTYLAGEEPSQ